MLWINLISDVFPCLALAAEPPEPDVLRRPPRDPHEPIIPATQLGGIAGEAATISASALAAYGYGLARYGVGHRAGTIAFTSLIIGQLLHAWTCRSQRHGVFTGEALPPNRYLDSAVLGSLGLQTAALLIPGLRGALGLESLGPDGCTSRWSGWYRPVRDQRAKKALDAGFRRAEVRRPEVRPLCGVKS